MVTRWRFDDATDASELVFAGNPADGGETATKRNVLVQTTSPTHHPIIVESGAADKDVSFRGTLLSVEERDALLVFVNKERPVVWTDDLGEERRIYIDDFTATRKKRASHTYIADYTIHAIVIE